MQKSSTKVLGAVLGSTMLVGALAGTLPGVAQADTTKGGVKVTVKPTTGLKNGQTISIKGSKFTPNTAVFLVECKDAKGKNCTTDSKHLKSTKSSSTGAISAKYKVYTGTVCAKHKTCYLAVAQADGTKGAIRTLKFK